MLLPFSRFIRRFVPVALVVLTVCALLLQGVCWAKEKEKTVAEKVLDILKSNNQITEEQYKELVAQAKEEERQGKNFDVFYKEGLNFESENGAFKIKIGGRIQTDFGQFEPDKSMKQLGDEEGEDIQGHGAEMRRARLMAEGTIYENVEYKAEFDFAEGDVDFADVYLGVKDIPYMGGIRVGHQKEPFSLEEQTSTNYMTFMERGLPNAFSPVRNTGVKVFNTALDNRMTWGVGAFEDTDNFGDGFANYSDYNVSGRITGLPWYEKEGRELIHLGLSYNHRFRDGDNNPVRFRTRPEAHLTDLNTVDTGSMPADGVDVINPEFALVYGPFSLQGEYFQTFVNASGDSDLLDDPTFNGFYIYASYFITGEHRAYKPGTGAFDRIKPFNNFSIKNCGWGAWEIAARYSRIDLTDNDAGIRGGEEDNFTAGLNWYLNPNTRIMFNYVRANVEDRDDLDGDGTLDVYQSRFMVDF